MAETFEGFIQEPRIEEVKTAEQLFDFFVFEKQKLADRPHPLALLAWTESCVRGVLDGTTPLYRMSPGDREQLREQTAIYNALERVLGSQVAE